jgi:hypothetical protein
MAGQAPGGMPGQPQPGQPMPGQPMPGQAPGGMPGQPQPGMPGGQMMAPQPGQMAPGQMAGAAPGGPSVMGVPLQQGERVVYFYKPSYGTEKIVNWILFVFTFWILIGFYFLYLALTLEKKSPKAQIVTTNRVIVVPGEGEAISYSLQNVADVEPERQKSNAGGGGLLGAAISAGVSAVQNSMADKQSKVERKYWKRSIAVFLIDQGGMKHKVVSKDAVNLGMFLANGMVSGGFNQAPDVPFEG